MPNPKTFSNELRVYAYPQEVEFSQVDMPYKYFFSIYKRPKEVAVMLRRIADWLDSLQVSKKDVKITGRDGIGTFVEKLDVIPIMIEPVRFHGKRNKRT